MSKGYITSSHVPLVKACHVAEPKANEARYLLFAQEAQQDIQEQAGVIILSQRKGEEIIVKIGVICPFPFNIISHNN